MKREIRFASSIIQSSRNSCFCPANARIPGRGREAGSRPCPTAAGTVARPAAGKPNEALTKSLLFISMLLEGR